MLLPFPLKNISGSGMLSVLQVHRSLRVRQIVGTRGLCSFLPLLSWVTLLCSSFGNLVLSRYCVAREFISTDDVLDSATGAPFVLYPRNLMSRAADLLPVVLIVEHGPQGALGLMMNRRSGILMGDLGDDFRAFMIQVIALI